MSERIAVLLKVQPDLVHLTEGEPLSLQTIEVILKGRKVEGTLVKEQLSRIEKKGQSLLGEGSASLAPHTLNCKAIVMQAKAG